MISTIIVLLCMPLPDNKERAYVDLWQYANELRIQHYPEEYSFDVRGDYKGNDEDCYWVSIKPPYED
mgnify:FL=1|tara:strand:- start:23 stop:223 length:201 start_codon:yes stop_codon:yes gene_type:complete